MGVVTTADLQFDASIRTPGTYNSAKLQVMATFRYPCLISKNEAECAIYILTQRRPAPCQI